MQLHTQSSQKLEETESDEFDCKYRDKEKSKSGRRHRRKKIVPSDSQDSILDFPEEGDKDTDTNENLPDLIQDANSCTKKSTNIAEDYSIPDCGILKKKSSLPNGVIDGDCPVESFVTDTTACKKKFSLPSDKLDSTVEDFVNEVIFTISEIGSGNHTDGVKKFRGIIKKTLSCEKDDSGNIIFKKRCDRPKNKVHFSEENITIEIPRAPLKYHDIIKEMICYYCCFGFLFPNT